MNVTFILYYRSPPHSKALVRRARCELEEACNTIIIEGKGPPAETLNVALGKVDTDWLAAWDPHFRWLDGGYRAVSDMEYDDSTAAICFPCIQKGPQDAWRPFLGDIPTPAMRLLVCFRTEALRSAGGFKAAPSGRNWLMATIMALEDQGWRTVYPRMDPVCVHVDLDLSMEYFIRQRYMSGRDMAALWMRNKGHRHFEHDTLRRLSLLQGLPVERLSRLLYRTLEGVWLLGAVEGLGYIPSETIRPGLIEYVEDALE